MPNGMLNILVTEVQLNRPGVLAGIRQVEASRVAEHVSMHWGLDAGRFGYGSNNWCTLMRVIGPPRSLGS